MEGFLHAIAENPYLVAVANVFALASLIPILWQGFRRLRRIMRSAAGGATGYLAAWRNEFQVVAKKAVETPGYFAAYAARRTVVATVSIFTISLLFNVINIISQVADKTFSMNSLRIITLGVCIALSMIVLYRLIEIYVVSKMVLRHGQSDD